jgi:hypothetical protein
MLMLERHRLDERKTQPPKQVGEHQHEHGWKMSGGNSRRGHGGKGPASHWSGESSSQSPMLAAPRAI